MDRFSWNLISEDFRKSVEKIQVTLNSDKNKRYFTRRPKYIFIISRSFLLIMRNVSGKSCRENQNTHFVFSNFFPPLKSYRLWDNVEKYYRSGQDTDGIVHCVLDNLGYKYTLRKRNTPCSSTTTMVARTHLNVTLYVQCLSCFDVLLTVHLSIFMSVINQLDAQHFCFTISLFHASTCFEHMCSKHVEAWNKLIVKQNFCA